MMWRDYYLKFESKASFLEVYEALASVGYVDVIGVLYRMDTGAECAGYHVNARLDAGKLLPDVVKPYVLTTPVMPKRMFMQEV